VFESRCNVQVDNVELALMLTRNQELVVEVGPEMYVSPKYGLADEYDNNGVTSIYELNEKSFELQIV
jgi:hypothetical protein